MYFYSSLIHLSSEIRFNEIALKPPVYLDLYSERNETRNKTNNMYKYEVGV